VSASCAIAGAVAALTSPPAPGGPDPSPRGDIPMSIRTRSTLASLHCWIRPVPVLALLVAGAALGSAAPVALPPPAARTGQPQLVRSGCCGRALERRDHAHIVEPVEESLTQEEGPADQARSRSQPSKAPATRRTSALVRALLVRSSTPAPKVAAACRAAMRAVSGGSDSRAGRGPCGPGRWWASWLSPARLGDHIQSCPANLVRLRDRLPRSALRRGAGRRVPTPRPAPVQAVSAQRERHEKRPMPATRRAAPR
jgi:hypothetical protein